MPSRNETGNHNLVRCACSRSGVGNSYISSVSAKCLARRLVEERFSLNEHQTAQVAALQSEYGKDCEQKCARISQTDARAADLIRSHKMLTSEIREALSEVIVFGQSAG
jgi:hypothetical protein